MIEKQITVGTNSLLESARRLMCIGEINEKDYKVMIERNKMLSEELQSDFIEF